MNNERRRRLVRRIDIVLLGSLALTIGIAAILLWYLAFRELDEEETEDTPVPVVAVLSPTNVPTQAPTRTATASRTPLPSFTPSLTAFPIPTPQINPIPLSGLYAGQTITFSGQAQPGDIIIILDQDAMLAQTIADESGEWMVQFEDGLPEGVYALQVVAENADGDRSEASPVRLLIEQLPSPTSTSTASPSPTITASPSSTATETPTLTATPTTTITLTETQLPSETPLPTDTPTPISTETVIPSDTPIASITSEPTEVSIIVVTLTETTTLAPSLTDIPSETPTPFPTDTSTPTLEPTSTLTVFPTATLTDIPSETPTVLPSETSSPTPAPTDTVTSVPSPTDIPTETPTSTPSLMPSATNTAMSTETPTSTSTSSPTATLTATSTATPTSTPTAENTEVAQAASETPTIEAALIEIQSPATGDVVMAGPISIRGRGPANSDIQVVDEETGGVLAETTSGNGGQWAVDISIEEAKDVVLIAQLTDDPSIQSPSITITVAPIVQPRTGVDLTPDPENERGAAFTALLALLITAVGFTLIYTGRLLYAIAIRYDDTQDSIE